MSDSDKPISDKQRAANFANAQHSTGPRTPEGKARSSQNARKHGFTASTFAIVRLEDLDEIGRLKHDLIHDYRPVNAQELFAIERIALAQQTLLRIARLEAGLFTHALDEALTAGDQPMVFLTEELTHDVEVTRQQNRNFILAFGFHRMAQKANTWALFLRYQAQAERQYRRAVEEFERLQRLRPDLPNEPISDDKPQSDQPLPSPAETPTAVPAEDVTPPHEAPNAPIGPADAPEIPREHQDSPVSILPVPGTPPLEFSSR